MACRLFSAKPLPEPMLAYCQLDSWEQISVKFQSEFYHFHSRKCIWKCCLPEWRPFSPLLTGLSQFRESLMSWVRLVRAHAEKKYKHFNVLHSGKYSYNNIIKLLLHHFFHVEKKIDHLMEPWNWQNDIKSPESKDGLKQLPEPKSIYCQWDHYKHNYMKFLWTI